MSLNPSVLPEFSHVVPLSEIGGKAVVRNLQANDAERAALAKRFGLIALDSLSAEIGLSSDDIGLIATGTLTADVVQPCVVSGALVPDHITETYTIRFLPEPTFEPDADVELDAEDFETMFHDGRGIDLGEAVAQTLGLALNPFPRSPDAETVLEQAGASDGLATGPFAALAVLRKGTE